MDLNIQYMLMELFDGFGVAKKLDHYSVGPTGNTELNQKQLQILLAMSLQKIEIGPGYDSDSCTFNFYFGEAI